MIVIVFKYLLPKGYRGLTLWPFVFLKHRVDLKNQVLLNHERIHIRQQLELLVIPFYIWYLADFLYKWWKYKDKNKGYRAICFEREAYQNEKDLHFLSKRPFWNFLKYV